MPMRESLQLAAALAARHGASLAGVDWRPLLRYAAGNPLTITVVVGQALRENLSSTEQIEGFVARLQAGEAQLEAGTDAGAGPHPVAGRLPELRVRHTRSPMLSGTGWPCCTCSATPPMSTSCATMGDPEAVGEDAVPELAGLDRDAGIALLDRAADIGLLTGLGQWVLPDPPRPALVLHHPVHHRLRPARPARRPPRHPRLRQGHRRPRRLLPSPSWSRGARPRSSPRCGPRKPTCCHALDLARARGLWDAAAGCLQGLRVLYERTGRDSEWARLIADYHPGLHRPRHRRPTARPRSTVERHHRLPGSARCKRRGTGPPPPPYRKPSIAWHRDQAAAALAAPAASLTPDQRTQIRNLAVVLNEPRRHPP